MHEEFYIWISAYLCRLYYNTICRELAICSRSGHNIATAHSRDGLYYLIILPKSYFVLSKQSSGTSLLLHKTKRNTIDLIRHTFVQVGPLTSQKTGTSSLEIPVINKKPSFQIDNEAMWSCDIYLVRVNRSKRSI